MELYARNAVYWTVIRGFLAFNFELRCLVVPACLLRLSYDCRQDGCYIVAGQYLRGFDQFSL